MFCETNPIWFGAVDVMFWARFRKPVAPSRARYLQPRAELRGDWLDRAFRYKLY